MATQYIFFSRDPLGSNRSWVLYHDRSILYIRHHHHRIAQGMSTLGTVLKADIEYILFLLKHKERLKQ